MKEIIAIYALQAIWMAELIDESLGAFRFLHDAFFVVLPN